MQFSPDSLPKKLQWLVAGPPQDESMTTAYGADRKFDRTTPWLLGLDHLQVLQEPYACSGRTSHAHVILDLQPRFHSVLCDLNDPLVILHRKACSDAPPGWTKGGRALDFHREDFVKQERLWQAL